VFASIIALALPYAAALDVNGGVINTNTGGFSDGYLTTSNDNPLNPDAIVDIYAHTSVPIGTTAGESYSDFQTGKVPYTPNPVTATKSGLTPYPNAYYLYAFAGGHVQTGIKTTATTTTPTGMYDAEATARIYARSSQVAGSLDGNAYIESTLYLPGKSEGYAIASGTAGYTGSVEATSTINRNKIDGMVGGTTNLSGVSGLYKEIAGTPITYAYTTAEGDASIRSSASSAGPTIGALTSTSAGFNYDGGIFETNNVPTTEKATSYMGGNANGQVMIAPFATATAWDQTFAIMDDSNARSQSSLDVDSVAAIAKTTQAGDYAYSGAHMNAYADPTYVSTSSSTHANVDRAGDLGTKMSAEAFINGGSWSALDRTTSFNTMSANGSMGSYLNGMASGAHLISPDDVYSNVNFDQHATLAETAEVYSQYTDGPTTSGKANDDAGSYFSQGGYVTSVSGVRVTGVPISTSIASGYDINWVNGRQTSVFNYGEGFALTDNPAGSATIDIARTPSNVGRTNSLHKNFGQV
jgi:hypothetical protein